MTIKAKLIPGIPFILFTILASCTYQAAPVSSQGIYDRDYQTAIARGRNIVAPLTRRGSAVSVAVGVDGKLVWSEGFGYTSRDGISPLRPEQSFYLYSLMKQVTAVLAMQSVLNGEIGFETTAGELIPDLPGAYQGITLQQLITHRGGVRHYYHPAEANMFRSCDSALDALGFFVNDPLVHAPGTAETYSSYGFILASAMLEKASGLSFPQLVEKRIARNSGLSTLHLDARSKPGSPDFYDVDERGVTSPALPVNNSCKMGGGGFLASAEDLVRFHNAVLQGDLVPEAAVRQLLGSRSSLQAGGSGPGGEAVSVVDLDARVSIVVLSNTSGLEQRIALDRVRDTLLSVFIQ